MASAQEQSPSRRHDPSLSLVALHIIPVHDTLSIADCSCPSVRAGGGCDRVAVEVFISQGWGTRLIGALSRARSLEKVIGW